MASWAPGEELAGTEDTVAARRQRQRQQQGRALEYRLASDVPRSSTPVNFNLATLTPVAEIIARYETDSVEFIGAGGHGAVFGITRRHDRARVAVKLCKGTRDPSRDAAHEIHGMDRLLQLARYGHTWNSAQLLAFFHTRAAITEATGGAYRIAEERDPRFTWSWIEMELVATTFDAYFLEQKRLIPASIVFEFAWFQFVCAKYLGASPGDRKWRNYGIVLQPGLTRAYHIHGDVYVFPADAPMYKRIDIEFDVLPSELPYHGDGTRPLLGHEKGRPSFAVPREPGAYEDPMLCEFERDLVEAPVHTDDAEFAACLRGPLTRERSRYPARFAPLRCTPQQATLQYRGPKVRHFYA